jgi:HTH-type transcriptional regulator/antitoxin HigA
VETVTFSASDIREMARHFDALTARVPLHPIANEDQYDEAVAVLNALLDLPESSEGGPLAGLLVALGEFVGDYEDANHDLPDAPPAEVLRELMSQHRLKQSDLHEIGSQGVVSEVLNGRRELNARQIAILSKRFHVSPAVFFPA